MSIAAERAGERLRRFAERHGDAVRLARVASLAVRIDAPLLRTLRLRFLPGTDAGIEGDLWFSPLTESMSSQGFVLAPAVAEILRRDLAAEKVGAEHRALDAAARLIDEAHRDWPPALRMEERITWLALKDDAHAAAEIEALLRQAAKAMVQDEERGREVARWALRALPRLPAAGRATGAAALLALGAADRLGGRAVLAIDDAPAAALQDAAWILPPESLAKKTTIGLRRLEDGLEFVDTAATNLTLELPKTTPLVVRLSWSAQGRHEATAISVQPGRRVALPREASEVRIRTLAGDEFELESAVTRTAEVPQSPAEGERLFDAAVLVESDEPGSSSASAAFSTMGFFVAADLVLTPVRMGTPRADGAIRTSPWSVHYQGQRVAATVAANEGGLVLLRLSSPIEGAFVLPRATQLAAVESGATWQTVSLTGTGPAKLLHGRLVSIVTREFPGGKPELMLELATDTPDPAQIVAGAPVVIGGQIAGLIAETVPNPEPTTRILALTAARFNDFVYRSLRPPEHEPTVYVAYSRSSVGQGEWTPSVDALERLKNALVAARVLPWIDNTALGRDEAWLAQTVAALNDSEGAVVVLSPALLMRPDTSQRQLHMVAYRFWAKRDYPVAVFETQRGRTGKVEQLPPLLATLFSQAASVALDTTREADLAAHAQRAFERLSHLRDASAGEAAVLQRLATLLAGAQAERNSQVQQGQGRRETGAAVDEAVHAILERGLFAEIDWPAWLRQDAQNSGAAVVDIAAMFTLPAETARFVRAAAHQAPGERAVCLNAMPVNIARALINRAWIGEPAPVSLVFRDQQWPELGSADDAPHAVAAEVGRLLACDEETARWLLHNIAAPVFLIFATRPLPPRAYMEALQRELPHAVLFFLCGQERPDPPLLEGGAMTELPPLSEGEDGAFLIQYKRLMELAAPRTVGATEGDSRKRAPKKSATPKQAMAGNAPPGKPATKRSGTPGSAGDVARSAPEKKSAARVSAPTKAASKKEAKRAPPKRVAKKSAKKRVLRKKSA